DDVFVPQSLIRRFRLRTGDILEGEAGSPPGRGKSSPLLSVGKVSGVAPDEALSRPDFSTLPAAHPDEKLVLEGPPLPGRPATDVTTRIVDLIAPLGKGQRTLIVAPARAGKTMLLQAIMHGVANNYPEALLLVLL